MRPAAAAERVAAERVAAEAVQATRDAELRALATPVEEPPAPATLNLYFRKKDGTVITFPAGLHEPFGSIKRGLEPVVDIISSRIRLICMGRPLLDDDTPASKDVVNGTLMHIVLSSVNLADKLSSKSLKANCRICETGGAQFHPRPLCTRCGSEGVLWTGGLPVIVEDDANLESATTFGDLANWKISCPFCGDAEDAQMPAGVGFLCKTETPFVCNLRHAAGSRLQFVYMPAVEGAPPTPTLHDRLLQLFSYAQGGGLEASFEGPGLEAPAAGAGAGAGSH